MSLFKCRDWWSTRSGHDEEFGPGGMALGNVDDDSNNVEKIITGSFSGMLRIYLPKERNYSVNDLLMEAGRPQSRLRFHIHYHMHYYLDCFF